ncbi:McrC family protein [Nocardioides sp.]|uniref:McrC family protein n=1 Tax=Nocardioides sp. TaxID=35761 RepID=UPI002EDA3BEA
MVSSEGGTICRLSEYSTSAPLRVDDEQRRQLLRLAAGRFTVLAGPEEGSVLLRSTSFVGSVRVGDLTIEVAPKVPMQNLFALFAGAAEAVDWAQELGSWARSEFVEGVAAFVVRSIDEATSRGMLHGYRQREERVPVIRGRLLVDEIARRPWDLAPAPCRFDDFTADTIENRILLASLREMTRWPSIDFATRRRIRRLVERFSGVAAIPAAHALAGWPAVTRLNEHLSVALGLARLVLGSSAISHRPGEQPAHAFLVDMNVVFERWVASELARRLAPRVEVQAQYATYLARGARVPIRPDLVFTTRQQVALVGDTKYKLVEGSLARSADYYQMLAYAVSLGTRAGLLVYCSADDQREKVVTVRNIDKELICYQLPLSGDVHDLHRRIADLADYVRELCERSELSA